MLSYRHGFHAGNFADLLKHLVLVQIIEYLKTKPAPIRYIDTHAGAGLYDLDNAMSRKTGEFRDGVGALDLAALPQEAEAFCRLLGPFLACNQYPGSPLIAARLLRRQDELRLYEMHSTEFPKLAGLFARDRRVRALKEDGFGALKSQLPVQNARALILIDPSYELDSDYQRVVTGVAEGLRRMPHAVYGIWYPLVATHDPESMLNQLAKLGGEKSLRVELSVDRNPRAGGMNATGMFIINPPWLLARQLREILGQVSQQLGGRFDVQ
jgi:23S rRNA (adenine2030-N6)-methyltransferase